jgi:hypothetical protein
VQGNLVSAGGVGFRGRHLGVESGSIGEDEAGEKTDESAHNALQCRTAMAMRAALSNRGNAHEGLRVLWRGNRQVDILSQVVAANCHRNRPSVPAMPESAQEIATRCLH